MNVADVLADLLAEQVDLDAIVAELDPDDWARPTPSPGWSVTEQIAHLTYFDRAAAFAIEHPDRWHEETERLFAAADEAGPDPTLAPVVDLPVGQRLAAWRDGRTALARAAATLADDTRVPWYGPSMGAKSFLTARLMECWAHGQDIVDAVGAHREPTERLRHVAQLGVITRGWSYANRGLEPPPGEVRVELDAPSGERWTWGLDDAEASIVGPALGFCLVVTQRRHVDDVSLRIDGDIAWDWMHRAQAFAGPATDGPPPGATA